MKVKFCLFLLLLFAASTQAQRQVKVYLDEKGKLTKDESTASYYRIITFNKNNKSGVSKGYTTSGKIMYVGKFLSTDLNNLLNDVPDGECIWYHENGTYRGRAVA